jgi:TPR repeat protein
LALAGCGLNDRKLFYDSDPIGADPINFRIAFAAQRRGDDVTAAKLYQRSLNTTGHPMAALLLGRLYLEGKGVPEDPARAAQLFQIAYDKSWPGRGDAAFYLGRLYDSGSGVPEDKAKAFEYHTFARSQGVKGASYPLAVAYDEGRVVEPNRGMAIQLYQEAIQINEPRASLRLAELAAEEGAPAIQVHRTARPGIAWLRQLASERNDWAEMRLATIYTEGKLAPPDPDLVTRYLSDAARHGNASANARMAERAEERGDSVMAMIHWRKAADGGHPSGMVRVGMAALQAGQVEEGLALLQKAAGMGHTSAMVEIGRRELTGDGLPADPADGIRLLTAAAELGHPSAMYTLGQLYADGKEVPKNMVTARRWLEQAQEAGHPNAAKALAQLQPARSQS